MEAAQAELVATDALMDVATDEGVDPVLRVKAAARLLDHVDYAAEREAMAALIEEEDR